MNFTDVDRGSLTVYIIVSCSGECELYGQPPQTARVQTAAVC